MRRPLITVALTLLSCVAGLEPTCDNSTCYSTGSPTTVTELAAAAAAANFASQPDSPLGNIWKQLQKLFLPKILELVEEMEVSPKCLNHFAKVMTGLRDQKYWAFRMIDASGKIPIGMLSGTMIAMGDFDGCLEVNVKDQFQGKYCSIEFLPRLDTFELPNVVDLKETVKQALDTTVIDDDFTTVFLEKIHPYYFFLRLKTAVCVPSSCNEEDVEIIFQKILESVTDQWFVQTSLCEIKKELQFDSSEITVLCVFSILILLVGMGTAIDIYLKLNNKDETYKQTSGIFIRLLICFSAYSNTRKLLSQEKRSEGIPIFYGIRVVSMMWVILNHTYGFFNPALFTSLFNAKSIIQEIAMQFILNGFFNVESFFFVAAVLVAYSRINMKSNDLNIFLYIFRRFWRLAPPFMFVIAIAILVPHMASGPNYAITSVLLADRCKESWWSNLVFINNFVSVEDSCAPWMWYIAADMHMYIAALLVLIPMKKYPRVSLGILGSLYTLSIIGVAVNQVINKIPATALLAVLSRPEEGFFFMQNGYFKTHMHTITYCTGLGAGYFIATRPKLRIPLLFNIIGWLTSFILGLTVIYGVYYWNLGNFPSEALTTIYSVSSKIVWPGALAYITIACQTGNGGFITKLLSWSALVPLSRLTYMSYLIHPLVEVLIFGSIKVPLHTSHKTMAMCFAVNVVFSFIAAYALTLFFEAPFIALEKVMFGKIIKRMKEGAKSEQINGNMSAMEESEGRFDKNFPTIDDKYGDPYPKLDENGGSLEKPFALTDQPEVFDMKNVKNINDV